MIENLAMIAGIVYSAVVFKRAALLWFLLLPLANAVTVKFGKSEKEDNEANEEWYFIGERGRPAKDVDERLNCKKNLRTTEFEMEQAMMLAKRQGVSFNSYIRGLMEKDYLAYCNKKIQDAVEFSEMFFDSD